MLSGNWSVLFSNLSFYTFCNLIHLISHLLAYGHKEGKLFSYFYKTHKWLYMLPLAYPIHFLVLLLVDNHCKIIPS